MLSMQWSQTFPQLSSQYAMLVICQQQQNYSDNRETEGGGEDKTKLHTVTTNTMSCNIRISLHNKQLKQFAVYLLATYSVPFTKCPLSSFCAFLT
jgi:hypothetical protein